MTAYSFCIEESFSVPTSDVKIFKVHLNLELTPVFKSVKLQAMLEKPEKKDLLVS